MQQYVHYLPIPVINSEECNSTQQYNGKLDADKICAGFTDSNKSPCYVSIRQIFNTDVKFSSHQMSVVGIIDENPILSPVSFC